MGLGGFSPPIGLGLYATCGVCDVQMKHVIGPMTKQLVVIVAGLVLLSAFPGLTTWLPQHMGYGNS
jgi:C4-dicarboxylate transporter DctM subunit